MRKSIKDVDKEAVVAYMVKHNCRLDMAIAAVSGGVVEENSATVKESLTVEKPEQAVVKITTTEKPKTKLKAARIASGLSQSELARKADINVRTLQAYEQGSKILDNARLDTILKIALACGCSIENILEKEDHLELIREYLVFFGVIKES